MRRRALLAALGAGALLPLLAPVPAVADPADDAVAALRDSSVYVGADTPTIDRSKLGGDTLSGIKVAIVPTGGPSPVSVARTIGSRLDPDARGLTVLVFEGRSYGAASTARCGVGTAINQAVARHRSELQSSADVTSTVSDFARTVHDAPSASDGCSDSSATGFGEDKKGSSHTGLIVLLVLVAAVLAAIGYVVSSRRRRQRRQLSDARAQVVPYYERLANEVNTIDPKDDATARQAMADAAERFNSAGSQLATADSAEKYEQARRTTLEGLYAARTARTAVGLDPGPPLPPVAPGGGEQLDRPREVTVQGQNFQGYPAYTPGAPYYFGGAYGIPGGWYAFPFWETLLVGSMLGGGFGFGGLGYGGFGYGAGYDNGYLTGYNAGENAADDSGADGSGWGDSGGGGDWGGGGGGWGDAGGGDWGGGGDFGGGGDSGGGSW
jgi:hypothetical protein